MVNVMCWCTSITNADNNWSSYVLFVFRVINIQDSQIDGFLLKVILDLRGIDYVD